jgi:ribonuclease J
LDGATSIGGNKIHLESGGKGLFLDFGINFRRLSRYYEEYLKPRTIRGIYDYLTLGLVPPFDIYERFLIPADLDTSGFRELRVDGVLLSHAHVDHSGCIGLLKRDIPVYCSAMTAAILKAYQDSGRPELHCQAVYTAQRTPLDDPRILKGFRQASYVGRDFFITTPYTEEFERFWGYSPAQKELTAGELGEAGFWEPPLVFEDFEVDHSVYGSRAFAIETEEGWIVYTGDLRMHGARAEDTKRFVRQASRLDPKVLLVEGTTASREEVREETESEVYQNCLSAISGERGLAIADFSPRNFERLETFQKIARESGRELVVTAKDAYTLDAMGKVDGVDRMKDLLIYRDLKERRDKWEQDTLRNFEKKLVDPADVSEKPGSYILCFSFWDVKNLLDVRVEGGTYVYSGSEAFNEEDVFSFERLWEWLRFFKLRVVGFRMEGGKIKFERGYHASGHASPGELLEVVEEINPKMVVPVHTENPEFFKEMVKGREVRIVKNGDRIEIS